jgi:hypothetical protein
MNSASLRRHRISSSVLLAGLALVALLSTRPAGPTVAEPHTAPVAWTAPAEVVQTAP